jgi:putative integral membrane protein (TIGR02587 family)
MDQARAYIRATGGGLLVGLPTLFTQEVWSHAVLLPAWKILLLLGLAFVVVLGYNGITGFRKDSTTGEVVIDSVEAMGIGLVVSLVALIVLGRIDAGTSVRDAVGQLALESIPIAFGASLARAELGGDEGGGRQGRRFGPFERLFVAAGGALLFSHNVAATEESVMIGIEASPGMLLGLMATTLLVTLALVFVAEFGGRSHRGEGILGHAVAETVAAYAISLGVAWVLLWSFGRIDGAGLPAVLGMTVGVGTFASLGAAVGRILIAGGGASDQEGA